MSMPESRLNAPGLDDVATWLVERGRPLMLTHPTVQIGKDSCLGATRLAIVVLELARISARPVPCKVTVMNPRAAEKWAANEAVDPAEEKRRPDGAYVLSTNPERREGKFAGHLVAVVDEPDGGAVIFDLSADQFSRPLWTMPVEPTVVRVSAGWEDRVFGFTTNADVRVAYERIDDTSYKAAPDWRRKGAVSRVIGDIVRKAKKELDL